MLEGPKLVAAALEGGVIPEAVFTETGGPVVDRCRERGSEIFETSRSVIQAISTTVEPQDPVAVAAVPAALPLVVRNVAVLVDIADPGNLGTLIRTAAALGWQAALLRGTDPWSPKALRAGAGAQLARAPIRIDDVSRISSDDFTTVATVVTGGRAPEEIESDRPIALLIGSEAHGLAMATLERCEQTITIPMSPGIESLNAGVAGAISMYALAHPERQIRLEG